MYADKITHSMQQTIEETDRRREKQLKYNEKHNITPKQIIKSRESIMGQTAVMDVKGREAGAYIENDDVTVAADPIIQYMSQDQLKKAILKSRKSMEEAVKELDFIAAAKYRDELFSLQETLKLQQND